MLPTLVSNRHRYPHMELSSGKIERGLTSHNIGEPLPPRRAYDLAAEFYDRREWMRFWEINETPLILELLQMPKSKKILDVGCGTGFYGVDLIRNRNEVYGVDFSTQMLGQFRRKVALMAQSDRDRAHLVCADGENIPFTGPIIDACLIIRTLGHVEKVERMFREVYQLLKAGGILVIADLHQDHSYNFTVLKDPRSGTRIPVVTYKRSAGFYIELLERCGFNMEVYKEISYGECSLQPVVLDNFEELSANPKTPIFFVSRFKKANCTPKTK